MLFEDVKGEVLCKIYKELRIQEKEGITKSLHLYRTIERIKECYYLTTLVKLLQYDLSWEWDLFSGILSKVLLIPPSDVTRLCEAVAQKPPYIWCTEDD